MVYDTFYKKDLICSKVYLVVSSKFYESVNVVDCQDHFFLKVIIVVWVSAKKMAPERDIRIKNKHL